MQEQTTLRVEMVIRGQYVIEDLLGRNGSGATYLVRDQHARDASSSLFVLKEMDEPNKQARHRLASAGKCLRRLHHPGLPRVHRVLNDDKNNQVYLLIDYIAGQDLETLRQQQHEKLFSWTEVMSIMAPVIAAVTYLHRQQPPIIHGDIKPANIIRPKEDSGIVLVDFGIMKARDPGPTTASSRNCYRAPEQSNGSIDVQTDIYALGATCYTLVTGKLPPDAHSRLTQVGNEALDPLEPVNSVVPAIPMHIGKAIERAMSLNAQHRFSSVEQFWEALWLLPAEQPAPVFDTPSVPKGPPDVPAPGLGQAVGQTVEKPVPEPPPVVPVLESIAEPEDLDAEMPSVVPGADNVEEPEDLDAEMPPGVPVSQSVEEPEHQDAEKPLPGVPVPQSVEEPEDPDATVRLSKLPPAVQVLHSVEGQRALDIEKPLPKPPAGVKEQKDLIVVNRLPKLSGDVRAPISLRKLGMLLIVLALLLSLGIGASFLSLVRSHPTASSATPASHAASDAFTSTSAPVTSSYSTLARIYTGTIYDISANLTTKMSLTGIQQTQRTIGGNFTGLHRTGTFNGTIDPSKHLQFTVKDSAGHFMLSFEGDMQSDGELSGNYCNVAQDARCTGEYGVWSVAPTS